MSRWRDRLLVAVRAVRTAWDIFGITLALGGAVLLVVLVSRSIRGPAAPPGEGPGHPYAGESWRPGWVRENASSLHMRWEPYVYWQRRPFQGRYITVDSAGFRWTPQPVTADSAKHSVWFFGGSTMWGTGQRDSMTIPAFVARALAERGVAGVRVRNFGETGYVSTQELLRLMLELRRGERPDVVVFYDGINDAVATAMNGRCGVPQNESRRQVEFAIGRFLTLRASREFGDMLRSARAQVSLDEGVARGATTPELHALGHAVLDCYVGNVMLIEALAAAYRFTPLYVWQPTPSAAPKPMTPFELRMTDSSATGGMRPYLWAMNRVTANGFDSALAAVAPGRAVNLARLFATDTGAVWLDFVGHLTERANSVVAQQLVGPIVQALAARPGRH